MCGGKKFVDVDGILKHVKSKLEGAGIHIDFEGLADSACCGPEGEGPRMKVVCVAPGMKETVEAMGASPRDQVVMVRVDEETRKALDAWVETGAVKSRSEAAALFIREGLKVRKGELDELRESLDGVEAAKDRLRQKAREVFGDPAEG